MRLVNYSKRMSKLLITKLSVVALFLVFFSVQGSAQVFNPLLSEGIAMEKLESEIPTMERALDQLDPKSGAHAFALRKLSMYVHTYEILTVGEEVRSALIESFNEFAIDEYDRPYSSDIFSTKTPSDNSYGDPAFDQLVKFLER